MGTIIDFEGRAARMLSTARREHDDTKGMNPILDARSKAVTVWRRTAYLMSDYCGRTSWVVFWTCENTPSTFRDILRKGSRFNRCRPDGTADLYVDSIAEWEETMSLEADRGALEVTLEILSAYCGATVQDLETVSDSPDLLLEMVRAGRPTR